MKNKGYYMKTTGDFLVVRVMQILIRLYNKEHLSKAELALEYGVSERTIQRDIMQRLESLPIAKDELGRYYLKDTNLLKTSKADLNKLAALFGLSSFPTKLSDDFINMLLSSPVSPLKSQNYEAVCNVDSFEILSKAIMEQKIIKAIHNEKARVLKPYKLINHLGVWYLLAIYNDEIRTFTMYKLKAIVVTNEKFILDENVLKSIKEQKHFFATSLEEKEVVLEVNGFAREYFLYRKILANQEIISKDKDKLILSTKISLDEELLSTIWQFIPYVKILAPKELALKNENIIKEYLEYLK